MGCPDWPKCFGQWIPPTQVSQLPANYQELYAHRGYDELTFNVVKTWTEYINRLAGMLIGIASIILFGIGLWARREIGNRPLVLSGMVALLIGFQGWLGATVVASVLTPWVITIHMGVAVLIIGLLSIISAQGARVSFHPQQPVILAMATAFTILQFLLGSQVRQRVDHGDALNGLSGLGPLYAAHATLAWLTAGFLGYLIFHWIKTGRSGRAALMGMALAIQMLSGIVFAISGLNAMLQPLHLVASTVVVGTLIYGWAEKS